VGGFTIRLRRCDKRILAKNYRTSASMYVQNTVLWDDMEMSISRFGGTFCLHLQGKRVNRAKRQQAQLLSLLSSCLNYPSIVKIKEVSFSERPVSFYQATRRRSSEDTSLHMSICFHPVIPFRCGMLHISTYVPLMLKYYRSKVNVKSSMPMKTYGGSTGIAPEFLTSALHGGEWSTSHPGRFNSPVPTG
jgi:hypothetical protein